MPIAKIQLEDGRIAKLEVPEGTTQAQVMEFASSHDFGMPETSLTEDIGAGEAFLTGAGSGLIDFMRGIAPTSEAAKQRFAKSLPLAGTPEQTMQMLSSDPIEKQAMAELEEKHPVATIAGEAIGAAAPFVPATAIAPVAATLPARMAITGALGATEAGILSRGMGAEGEDIAISTGIGGSFGAVAEVVLPRIGRLGSAIYRRVKGKAPTKPLITNAGQPTKELQSVLDEAGLSYDDLADEVYQDILRDGSIDQAQVARKTFLEEQGLKPTKAQVTRDATQFQTQQEAAKTTGRVRSVLEEQEGVLSRKFGEMAVSGEGAAAVASKIVDKSTALDKQITALYKLAAEEAPGVKNVSLNTLGKKLRQYASADVKTGGNVSAVVGQLKNLGVFDKTMRVKGRISVETAEEARKFINSLYDKKGGFGNSVLRELKEALDHDVVSASSADIFKQARTAKADFEKGLARAKVSKFDSRSKNLVRDIMENKIDPDELVKNVIFKKGTWRAEDLQQLKKYTGKGAEWDALKSDVFEEIKNRSFIGPEDANGYKALSRDKLGRAVDAIGWKRLQVLLEPNELKFIRDMQRVARLREPVRGTAIGKGPSAQAIKSFEKRLQEIPLVGALIGFVDYDAQGRALLKAKPKKIPTSAEKALPQMATAAGIPLALTGEQ